MEKLAEIADVDYRQVANIERGEVNPTLSTIYVFSKALDIPLADLFQFEFNEGKKGTN